MTMYRHSQRKTVEGWFSETDARIFELILKQQSDLGMIGSVAEIGLHHGKSFILLCDVLQPTEKAYGIDVFDNQTLNLDFSGSGSREKLLENLQKFNCNMSQIILDGRPSELVTATEIKATAGGLRFFSIDGGHWYSTVLSDLNLAKECLISGGVIAVDDFLRPEWPDVARAFHTWFALNSEEFEIIAIGFNKIYLTNSTWAHLYRKNLLQDSYLGCQLHKIYSIENINVPIYAVFFLPEWDLSKKTISLLKMYYPNKYFKYKSYKERLVKFKRTVMTFLSRLFPRFKTDRK